MNKSPRMAYGPTESAEQQDKKEMAAHNCVFCKIIAHQIPATIVKETEDIVVIKDLYPQAPFHFLIIPKKHISDIGSFTQDDKKLAGSLLMMAQELSTMDARTSQFRLVSNNGPESGQTVFHTHIHFLAGHAFKEKI